MRKVGEYLQVDASTSQPLGILTVTDISFWVRDAKRRGLLSVEKLFEVTFI